MKGPTKSDQVRALRERKADARAKASAVKVKGRLAPKPMRGAGLRGR